MAAASEGSLDESEGIYARPTARQRACGSDQNKGIYARPTTGRSSCGSESERDNAGFAGGKA